MTTMYDTIEARSWSIVYMTMGERVYRAMFEESLWRYVGARWTQHNSRVELGREWDK